MLSGPGIKESLEGGRFLQGPEGPEGLVGPHEREELLKLGPRRLQLLPSRKQPALCPVEDLQRLLLRVLLLQKLGPLRQLLLVVVSRESGNSL